MPSHPHLLSTDNKASTSQADETMPKAISLADRVSSVAHWVEAHLAEGGWQPGGSLGLPGGQDGREGRGQLQVQAADGLARELGVVGSDHRGCQRRRQGRRCL